MTMAVMFETAGIVAGQSYRCGCDDNGVAHVRRRRVVTGDDDDDGRGLTLSHHYRDPLAVVLSWSFDMYTSIGWRLVGWW